MNILEMQAELLSLWNENEPQKAAGITVNGNLYKHYIGDTGLYRDEAMYKIVVTYENGSGYVMPIMLDEKVKNFGPDDNLLAPDILLSPELQYQHVLIAFRQRYGKITQLQAVLAYRNLEQ